MSLGSTSVIAPRATPTASAQTWSRRAARAWRSWSSPHPLSPTVAGRRQRLPQIAASREATEVAPISQDGCHAAASHASDAPSAPGCKAVRLLVRGSVRGGAWATRRVGRARARGAANEVGMVRLFDLHALSCAGDTLIAIGLAGTIFFNVPLGEARSKVALYLLITMVPFALLAPVVGPLLDHFRHGRRYALAATMLGRAFLAYVISDHLLGCGLYPAAFGVLALSRAYGVARSAAVPRLLPEGIGLSQVGARASVYGTFAGAVVAPIGLAAFWFGPQWPLRVASVHLPGRHGDLAAAAAPRRLRPARGGAPAVPRDAAAAPRRRPPALRQAGRRHPDRQRQPPLPLRLPAALLRLRGEGRPAGHHVLRPGHRRPGRGRPWSAARSAVGTFLATAVGTRLRIRRPIALQSSGLTITAGVAVLAAIVLHPADGGAALPGHRDLQRHRQAGDRREHPGTGAGAAAGQRVRPLRDGADARLGGRRRGSASSRWPAGWASALAALLAVAAAVRAAIVAARLHKERLHGRPDDRRRRRRRAPSRPRTAGHGTGRARAGRSRAATRRPCRTPSRSAAPAPPTRPPSPRRRARRPRPERGRRSGRGRRPPPRRRPDPGPAAGPRRPDRRRRPTGAPATPDPADAPTARAADRPVRPATDRPTPGRLARPASTSTGRRPPAGRPRPTAAPRRPAEARPARPPARLHRRHPAPGSTTADGRTRCSSSPRSTPRPTPCRAGAGPRHGRASQPVGVGPAAAAAGTARLLALAEAAARRTARSSAPASPAASPAGPPVGATVLGARSIAADLGAESPDGFLPSTSWASAAASLDADAGPGQGADRGPARSRRRATSSP